MKSKWITKGTYELDIFDNEEYKNLIPLTEKNKDFIEGCVHIDSTYSSNLSDLVVELCSSYTRDNISEIIKEINNVNSTRLSEPEMEVLADRLSTTPFDNINYLKTILNGGDNDIKKLFNKIADSITFDTKTGKKRTRKNISFATKFIFHLSEELGCKAHLSYSKYDSKVAECLAKYTNVYDISGYSEDDFTRGNDLWDMFINKYNPCLTKLINAVKKVHGYSIRRDEIDHLIWYTQK